MLIPLSSILPIAEPKRHKVHLASWNGEGQPLDVIAYDPDEWIHWNRWTGKYNDFSRRYIFALADFYHQRDTWLFGGVFEKLRDNGVRGGIAYDVVPVPQFEPLKFRLKIGFKRPSRGRAHFLEKILGGMVVSEILPEPYSGQQFPGYGNIDLTWMELEKIIHRQRLDWKAALESTKGIYLLTDVKRNRRYVGSAYGGDGIWSRWTGYLNSFHGGNKKLRSLYKSLGPDYFRANFRFALLETLTFRTEDYLVFERETFWKQALLTRNDFGYNDN